MLARRLLAAGGLLSLLSGPACAGNAVTLLCDWPEQNGIAAYSEKMVADETGISITTYTKNPKTGQTDSTKTYHDNSQSENEQSKYKIDETEIVWEVVQKDPVYEATYKWRIDLRSGAEKEDIAITIDGHVKQRPTATAYCKPE